MIHFISLYKLYKFYCLHLTQCGKQLFNLSELFLRKYTDFFEVVKCRNLLQYNKNKNITEMSHYHTRQQHSYSMQKQGTADDIKKGLQRIKQAQIQVLRQLRKQDSDISRNHSLTYSKQTTYQTKNNFRFDGESVLLKQKAEKQEKQHVDSAIKENKLRQECITLAEDARKSKQACQKAQLKMKQYQKGEERALAKAQEAIANAISSEKKYIALKTQYDKINKQRQRLSLQLRRILKKQISDLGITHESTFQIPNKLIKQLNGVNESIGQLMNSINIHKCSQKKDTSSINKNNTTGSTNSVNSFTVSTFQTKTKLDKHFNNLILYLNSLQSLPLFHQNLNSIASGVYGPVGYQSNNFLSGSFRDDIKKIQEQLDHQSKGKSQRISELQNINQKTERKNIKLQGEVRQYQQQNNLLKTKIKTLAKQLEDIKLGKKVLEDEYQKFKLRSKQREKQKQVQFQTYKKKHKLTQSAPINLNSNKLNSKTVSVKQLHPDPEKYSSIFQDRIVDLQKQNNKLEQKIKKNQQTQKSYKQIIQKLKSELESANSKKQQVQAEMGFQINKLNAKANFTSATNMKSQSEWDQMVRAIRRLQEEKTQAIERQNELNAKIQRQNMKYQAEVEDFQLSLKALREQIQQLRKENTAISFDQTDLTRLRNEQNASREGNNFNRTVEQLWNKKQGEYFNVNNIIGQIKMQEPENIQPIQQTQYQTNSFVRPEQAQIYENSQKIIYNQPQILRSNPSQPSIMQGYQYPPQTNISQSMNSYQQVQLPMQMGMQNSMNQMHHPPIMQQQIQYPYQMPMQTMQPMQQFRQSYPYQNMVYR